MIFTMFIAIKEVNTAIDMVEAIRDVLIMENIIPTAININLTAVNTGTIRTIAITAGPIKSIAANINVVITASAMGMGRVIKAILATGFITADRIPILEAITTIKESRVIRYPNTLMTIMATGIKSAGPCVMTNMGRVMLWKEVDIKSGNGQ